MQRWWEEWRDGAELAAKGRLAAEEGMPSRLTCAVVAQAQPPHLLGHGASQDHRCNDFGCDGLKQVCPASGAIAHIVPHQVGNHSGVPAGTAGGGEGCQQAVGTYSAAARRPSTSLVQHGATLQNRRAGQEGKSAA